LGRRVQRVVNGLSTGYLYDGVQALAEFGANEAALLTGLAIDEAIGRFAASGDRTLLTDALGSVVAETRADQTIATAYGYSPYGETFRSGEDSGNSTQYTGRENDGTGMYFYRARYYDPMIKRFANRDPLETLMRIVQQYWYADDDPLMNVDPLGLQPIQLGVAGPAGTPVPQLPPGFPAPETWKTGTEDRSQELCMYRAIQPKNPCEDECDSFYWRSKGIRLRDRIKSFLACIACVVGNWER
jgi:RHS repeat-associated protein